MKTRTFAAALATAGISWLLLAGCETRSISDSGYRGGEYGYRGGNSYYHGELTEAEVLIDVATGHWSADRGKPAENAALSAQLLRGSSDQKQVAKLKAAAYASLVDDLVARSS